MNVDDDEHRDDDLHPNDCDRTTTPVEEGCLQTVNCKQNLVIVKEEIKIEVDLSYPIEAKDENTSVKENIKKEDKIAAVKKVKQKGKPGERILQSVKNNRRKLFATYIITKKINNGITYSCKNCEGTYTTKKAIYKHIFTNHDKRCKCEQCGKHFKFISHLEKHVKIHHGTYACRFCEKKFDSKYRLITHEKTHTNQPTYQCDYCQKELKYKNTLRKHILSLHTENRSVLCDICGWAFNQRSNLEGHIRTVHLKLRPFPCTICGKTYTAKKHLKSHMKIAHSGNPKPYKCDVCTKSFACHKYFKIHKLTHENHFACRYCSLVFNNKKDLEIHMKSHTTKHLLNSPYSCHICGKVLLSRFTLNRHLDNHSGIRKYSCEVCGLKFTQKALLKRHHLRKHDPDVKIEKVKCDLCKKLVKNIEKHMDIHDADKRKFFCDMCGKNYPTNNALNRHKEQKHFGVSYDCDVCGKKYIKKGSLQTHKLKIHKIKKEIVENVASIQDTALTSAVM